MERTIGNLLRHKPAWERALDWIRIRFVASGPVSTERRLAHEAGKSLWNLVRALMFPRLPGVWSETIPVPSLRFALNDARRSLWAMQRYRDDQNRRRDTWNLGRRVKRLLIHLSRLVSRRDDRALFQDREWRAERIQRLVKTIDELDGGTWANRVVMSRVLLQEAEDAMLKPSLEHSMTLLLYVYVCTDDRLRLVDRRGGAYADVERCFRYVARLPGYDRRWDAVYGARRFLIQGLRATEQFQVRAEMLETRSRDERGPNRCYEEARDSLHKAIHYCELLEYKYRSNAARHLKHLARFRLWLAAVGTGRWSEAVGEWEKLDVDFVESAVPRIREFADYAPDFGMSGEAPESVLDQLEDCLRTAVGIDEEPATGTPPARRSKDEGRIDVDTVEDLLRLIDEARGTSVKRLTRRAMLAVGDKEHYETAARALDRIRAYRVRLTNQRRRGIAAALGQAPPGERTELRRVLGLLPSFAFASDPVSNDAFEVLCDHVRKAGTDVHRDSLKRALRAIVRSRRSAAVESGPSLSDCAKMLRESRAALGGEVAIELRERTAAHLVNVVRVMAKRLVKKHYGEGVREVSHVQLRELLRSYSLSEETLGSLDGKLGQLLRALKNYEGTSAQDREIQSLAGQAVGLLVHRDHPLSALAEINLALPDKHEMDAREFSQLMQGVADRCERWCKDGPTGRVDLRQYSSLGYDFPGPARIASYAGNNSLTLILHRVVTCECEDDAERWFQVVRDCIERMRRIDPEFELIQLAEALLLAVEGHVGGSNHALHEFVRQLGESAAANLMAKALEEEDSDELVDLLCRGIEDVHGPGAITMVTAVS